MRILIASYIFAFLLGVLVGLLIAWLIIAGLPDYPYVHGLIA